MNISYKIIKFFLYIFLNLYSTSIFTPDSWSADKDTIGVDDATPEIVRKFEAYEKEFPIISKAHQYSQIKPFIDHISPLYLPSNTAHNNDKREYWHSFLQTIEKYLL